jgi:hypothetical protein
MFVADSNSAKFEFSLHSPQFRIDDGLDEVFESAGDMVQRATHGFALDPSETVIARRFRAMRRTIVPVNQAGILFVADKEMGHFDSPHRLTSLCPNMDVKA